MKTAYHFELVARSGCHLNYHDCRMWAQQYQLDPANEKSAIRIMRDRERGGWKCAVSFYL